MSNSQDKKANIAWIEAIIARIKKAEELRFDTEIAPFFGVDKTTIGKWKSRGTIPYEHLVKYAQQKNYALDWLLLGLGPMEAQHFEKIGEETNIAYRVRQIDYKLFSTIALEVRNILKANNIAIIDEQMQAKIDQLITYVYNDMIKSDEYTLDPEQLHSLIKMIE